MRWRKTLVVQKRGEEIRLSCIYWLQPTVAGVEVVL